MIYLAFMIYCCVNYFTPFRYGLASRIASVLILVGLYITFRGPVLGDDWARTLHFATRTDVHLSSVMAHGIYFAASFLGIAAAYVPVIAGGVASFVMLTTLREMFPQQSRDYFFATLLYFGAGLHILFLFDYIETTGLSVPALAAFYWAAHRYLAKKNSEAFAYAYLSAAFLGLATAIHTMNAGMVPLFLIMVAMRRASARSWKTLAIESAAGLAIIAVIYFASVGILAFLKYAIVTGDLHGGGDGKLLVPLFVTTSGMERYTFFTVKHFIEAANILSISYASAFAVPFLCVLSKRYASFFSDKRNVLAGFGCLAYISFVLLFNFDLGYPTDLDLMLALSTPMVLFCISLIIRLVESPWMRIAFIVAQTCVTWAYASTFFR